MPVGYECLAEVIEQSIFDLEQSVPAKMAQGPWVPGGSELLERYIDLAALDDDEEIYMEKVAVVWQLSEEETERLLQQLSARSLITETGRKHHSSAYEQEMYTIHIMQRDFLRHGRHLSALDPDLPTGTNAQQRTGTKNTGKNAVLRGILKSNDTDHGYYSDVRKFLVWIKDIVIPIKPSSPWLLRKQQINNTFIHSFII